MTTTAFATSVAREGQTTAPRLASIDIFRGLTMALMIYVNEQSEVRGLPWWNYHMKANVDAMTYVDMVFPFFLFIVGLSIPIAFASRLKRNPSTLALWGHVALRTASLMMLGLILTNADDGDTSRMIIPSALWAILALSGAVLFLNDYGKSSRHAKLIGGLRIFGLVLVIAMFAIFRHTPIDGHSAWIEVGYPEILGLIGYTYFAVAILYIPTRRWLWTPLAWFVALMAFNALTAARWITFTRHLPYWFFPWTTAQWPESYSPASSPPSSF